MNAISRHWQIACDAIEEEKVRGGRMLSVDQVDFLPAALEVIERPVSPTGRYTAWLLLFVLAASLTWAALGKVDIVASAQGRIIPADNVKIVQAPSSGIVRRIYVRDGDAVKKGQSLVDLDPTVSTAAQVQAEQALRAAELDAARNQAIADALAGKGIRFVPPAGTSPDVATTQLRLIEAQVAASRASVAGLAAARQSSLADAQGSERQIRKYDDTLPLIDRQLGSLEELAKYGLIAQPRLLDMRRQRRVDQGEREVAATQRLRALSDAAKYQQQLAQSLEEARHQALSDLAKAQSDVALRREELTKAQERSRLQRLAAPVDGVIQELAVHTIGGVVEPARTIMVVVPHGELLIEAKVLNKDAGFVRAGQEVAVKLDAFPFTRYGTLAAQIDSISADAVEDRKLGPVYIARVHMLANHPKGASTAIAAPGMSIVVDIKTGRRSILSYFVSPIKEAQSSAARER